MNPVMSLPIMLVSKLTHAADEFFFQISIEMITVNASLSNLNNNMREGKLSLAPELMGKGTTRRNVLTNWCRCGEEK